MKLMNVKYKMLVFILLKTVKELKNICIIIHSYLKLNSNKDNLLNIWAFKKHLIINEVKLKKT